MALGGGRRRRRGGAYCSPSAGGGSAVRQPAPERAPRRRTEWRVPRGHGPPRTARGGTRTRRRTSDLPAGLEPAPEWPRAPPSQSGGLGPAPAQPPTSATPARRRPSSPAAAAPAAHPPTRAPLQRTPRRPSAPWAGCFL